MKIKYSTGMGTGTIIFFAEYVVMYIWNKFISSNFLCVNYNSNKRTMYFTDNIYYIYIM
jgi:hypothetical protein